VEDWCRVGGPYERGVSNIWRCVANFFPIVGDWLAWHVGNGKNIKAGQDPIIGGATFCKLSTPLVNVLGDKGIQYLH